MTRSRFAASMLGCFGAFGAVAVAQDIDRAIAALRDDDTPWNAIRAMEEIRATFPRPIAELNEALASDDHQQRQLACALLWDSIAADRPHLITDRLIEVTIEGLRHDALPHGTPTTSYTPVWNAASGFHNLLPQAHRARAQLEAALDSDDAQQRLLSALILGIGGVQASADLVAPILLPHLRDNDIDQDAIWSVHALFRLGPAVVPHLEAALPDADDQQRELIELLLLDFRDPPREIAEFEARQALQSITDNVHDPAFTGPRMWNLFWLSDLPSADTP